MKYLLLIGLVLGVLWVLRLQRGRRDKAQNEHKDAPAAASPTEIVACGHCDMHLPRAEAVAGERGLYCSSTHRREAEGG
jgi:uncharacterized protein